MKKLILAVVMLLGAGVDGMYASVPLNEPDLSLVTKQFNFLETFDLKGKKVIIFGCGHGDHNEGGRPGDQGKHEHAGVTCVDISGTSKADHVMDVTKGFLPDDLSGSADVVYFEYLTPGIIYHPLTIANALKCLKPEGILMWDVYWGFGFINSRGDQAALDYLKSCKDRVSHTEIEFLNKDPRFQSLFRLSQQDESLGRYFSYGNNPFNGRARSQIFHVPKQDLEETQVNAFFQFYKPETLPALLKNLACLLDVRNTDELQRVVINAVLQELDIYDLNKKWHPEMEEKYQHFSIRLKNLKNKVSQAFSGERALLIALGYLRKAMLEEYKIDAR
jgi:hypothetical protein